MAYRGSEAYRLDMAERQARWQDHEPFSIVEGGGRDAREREGVSTQFMGRIRLALVCIVAVIALGVARVVLTTATVTALQANGVTQTELSDAQALNVSLRITNADLSNSARIDQIATENYGMVYAPAPECVSTQDPSAAASDPGQASSAEPAQTQAH